MQRGRSERERKGKKLQIPRYRINPICELHLSIRNKDSKNYGWHSGNRAVGIHTVYPSHSHGEIEIRSRITNNNNYTIPKYSRCEGRSFGLALARVAAIFSRLFRSFFGHAFIYNFLQVIVSRGKMGKSDDLSMGLGVCVRVYFPISQHYLLQYTIRNENAFLLRKIPSDLIKNASVRPTIIIAAIQSKSSCSMDGLCLLLRRVSRKNIIYTILN